MSTKKSSRPTTPVQIREILKNTEGMSAVEIADLLGKNYETVRKALISMPDAYIDRWQPGTNVRGRAFVAVWNLAEVPENCPYPEKTC